MKRLTRRLERLEALIRPADLQFDNYFDLSRLSNDEVRRLIAISDICVQHGESALSPEQGSDAQELFRKSARESAFGPSQ